MREINLKLKPVALALTVVAMLVASTSLVVNCVNARPATQRDGDTAVPTSDFLDSIGVVTTFPDRGQPIEKTIRMVKYCAFRWVRAGIEGLTSDGPTTMDTFLLLHRETGVRFSWGLGSGGSDIGKLLKTGRTLARAGALLAFEGNNEPNNWAVTYKGKTGGGGHRTWLPVAMVQRDLYRAVKHDALLSHYPVWSISEPGAEVDNVGLQFLKIPAGAGTLLPAGTAFADFANVHNYIYHPRSPFPMDNKVWNAADPGPASRVDGLYGNYGKTWGESFTGYDQTLLDTLPRVTTESGALITRRVSEEMQGRHLINLYLAQFKRGYSYTSVYLLRDRVDEAGNQAFGFFRPDYVPRKAAIYLHNLTSILADKGRMKNPGRLKFSIEGQTATVHDLLLRRSDGTFQLVIWGERVQGSDPVTVELGHSHASVIVYDPTAGTNPVRTLKNVQSLELSVSDHPFVIAISGPSE